MSKKPAQDWRPMLPIVAVVPLGDEMYVRRVRAEDFTPFGTSSKGHRYVGEDNAQGMLVIATVDVTHHGRLLHCSISYQDRDPTWAEIKAVRAAFFPDLVDVAMILPKAEDYVNVHDHCFHLWQLPVAWGLR